MRKLYSSKGPKRVHPSPPSPSLPLLSSLPTALLALASTLSPQEQEVLSYLLDSEKLKENQPKSKNKKKKDKDGGNNYNHAPDLGCSCFGCYKSFWARWDASPNRHVIHLILDAFEETLEPNEANRRKKRGVKSKKIDFDEVLAKEMSAHEEKVDDDDGHDDGHGHDGNDDDGGDDGHDGDDGHGDDDEEEDEEEKSSVRRFVSWVFGMNN